MVHQQKSQDPSKGRTLDGNPARVLNFKITRRFPISSLEFGFIVVTLLGLVGVPCSRYWLLSFEFIRVFKDLHLCVHLVPVSIAVVAFG